jgi:raffinose/stachyose/melibiose transport system substrate-binding protein
MRFTTFIGAAVGAALALGAQNARADVTIHLLHVDQVDGPIWQQIATDYEKTHPGVRVAVDFLENEAFKAKLPTLLQSKDRPNIIYSWAGGVMKAQIDAGYIEDISASLPYFQKNIYPAALNAYIVGGHLYGVPARMSQVALFYNKALFAKAGVDADKIKTWDDFLAAVAQLKKAGVTPIVMAGGEKWPMHFYWSYLVMRLGGADVLRDAEAGKDGGFKNPVFVQAGERLKQLAALDPFQKGWLSEMFPASTGQFGDQVGAIDLMGNWVLGMQAPNSATGKGIPDDQIGLLPFPELPDGKGHVTDTLGGTEGLLITKGSPKEALDFLEFFSQEKEQDLAAAKNAYVPAVMGTAAALTDSRMLAIAHNVATSTWHQNFFDQDLGPSVGRVVNDISVAISAGQMAPAEGAAAVQDSWDQR